MSLTKVSESMSMRQAREGLTNLLYPSTDGSYRDLYRSGWLPSFYNQQWGGAQWGTEMQDAATGQTYKFTVATGNVQDDNTVSYGLSTTYFEAQGFKLSETTNVAAVWLKLYRTGTVNRLVNLKIYSDNGSGTPNTLLYNSDGINFLRITTNGSGEWYRIPFSTLPVLSSNTKYHIVIDQGTTDTLNYPAIKCTTINKYPHCNNSYGTSAAVWTSAAGSSLCFLIEAINNSQVLQPSGKFDSKLSFNEGSPVNQSRSLTQPLRNFFDGTSFTYLFRGDSFAKGKPICDFLYGLDHDRIVLTTSATTGFGILTLYTAAGTVYTVSGTSDLSTAAFKDIAIVARTKGDTGDYLQFWVNGVLQGQVTGSAFVMDPLMRELGTAWVGGGFPVAPGWTAGSLNSFASLPSAQGWTWTGWTSTATEANAMSVSGGKLFQNKSGYASTDTGYYTKTGVGFSNATGWTVEWKNRVVSDNNINGSGSVIVSVQDGTKAISVVVKEYFLSSQVGISSTADVITQGDFKTQEHVFTLSGKGSDYYLWIDGKLAIDGTGKLTTSNASNQIIFGDADNTASNNSDAIYSYLKYSTSGAILPQASTGSSISEAVFWSGDKSKALPDLYNAGNAVSAKTYCGLSRGYVGEGVVQNVSMAGVNGAVTTSVVDPSTVLLSDLEGFVLGKSFKLVSRHNPYNTISSNTVSTHIFIDGIKGNTQWFHEPVANYSIPTMCSLDIVVSLGLHKVETRWSVSGGVAGSPGTQRSMMVEAKS